MNTSPKTRLRRALTAAVASLAIAMPTTAALLASPQSAYAGDGGGTSSDTGGPQGSGSSGGTGDGSSGYPCRGENVWKNNTGENDFPYVLHQPNCFANPTWNADSFKLCQVGYQVFHFYGTKSIPAAAWTTSMINQDKWCLSSAEQRNQKYTFWSTSGYDAGGGDMDVARTNTNDTAAQDGIYKPVWRSVYTGLQNYTSGSPFEAGGSCTSVANTVNPLRKFLDDPTQPEEARQVIAHKLVDLFNARLNSSENIGWDKYPYARKLTGIYSYSYADPTQPATSPVTINWLTDACSSPMQYVSEGASKPDKDRITGYCYIPLERRANIYTKTGVSGSKLGYPTPSAGGGIRYSNLYRGTIYTPGQERDRSGNWAPTGSYDERIIDSWRTTMANWYGSKVKAASYAVGSKMGQLNQGGTWQVIPADPYPVGSDRVNLNFGAQNFNRAQAIDALRNYSRCRFGNNYAFTSDSVQNFDDTVNTTLSLVMGNQPVFHAGGYIPGDSEQTITVSPQNLACTGAGCTVADPTLKSLSYAAEVSMPTSYTRCDAGSARLDCDYAITDIQVGSKHLDCADASGPCRLQVDQATDPTDLKITLVFFKPTSAGDRVQANLSNVSATYTAMKSSKTLKMNLFDSSTGTVTVQSITIPAHPETQPVENIAVSGTPVALQNDGGVFRFFAPVIGAISSR